MNRRNFLSKLITTPIAAAAIPIANKLSAVVQPVTRSAVLSEITSNYVTSNEWEEKWIEDLEEISPNVYRFTSYYKYESGYSACEKIVANFSDKITNIAGKLIRPGTYSGFEWKIISDSKPINSVLEAVPAGK